MTPSTPSAATLPPLPSNSAHVVRRIRACESEVPAQLVLEHAMQAYALAAIAAQPKPANAASTLVNQQADDDGLWFVAQTAPEAMLQSALRRLHAAVEHDAQPAAQQGKNPDHLDSGVGGGVQAWQPIETAPKDGTHILGWNRGRVCEACVTLRDDSEVWTFGMWSGDEQHIKPTHWMPLPAAPTGEGA